MACNPKYAARESAYDLFEGTLIAVAGETRQFGLRCLVILPLQNQSLLEKTSERTADLVETSSFSEAGEIHLHDYGRIGNCLPIRAACSLEEGLAPAPAGLHYSLVL